MTTELEEQFFKTFGIEQKAKTTPCYGGYKIAGLEPYPKITDRILLELICKLTCYDCVFDFLNCENIETLKEYVLKECIDIALKNDEWLKHQIQQLFKEEE